MKKIEEALTEYFGEMMDNAITSSDIAMFFSKSEARVKKVLQDKQNRAIWIKDKLKSLVNRPSAGTERNGIEEKLDNLLIDHQNAYAEFTHKKEYKHGCLVRRLKLCLMRDDKIGVIKCLFDIDLLKSATKDARVSELMGEIARYTSLIQNDSQYQEYYDEAVYINKLVEEQTTLALECEAIQAVLDAHKPNVN